MAKGLASPRAAPIPHSKMRKTSLSWQEDVLISSVRTSKEAHMSTHPAHFQRVQSDPLAKREACLTTLTICCALITLHTWTVCSSLTTDLIAQLRHTSPCTLMQTGPLGVNRKPRHNTEGRLKTYLLRLMLKRQK